MGRKIQITKEQILKAGLAVIIRDGYSAISVKSIANELGTSTTPITWTFGSFDNYKRALGEYFAHYVKQLMADDNGNFNYRQTAEAYVRLAVEKPHFFIYLRSEPEILELLMPSRFVFNDENTERFRAVWSKELDIPEEQVIGCIRYLAVYIEGLASLALSKCVELSEKDISRLIDEAENAYRTYLSKGGHNG